MEPGLLYAAGIVTWIVAYAGYTYLRSRRARRQVMREMRELGFRLVHAGRSGVSFAGNRDGVNVLVEVNTFVEPSLRENEAPAERTVLTVSLDAVAAVDRRLRFESPVSSAGEWVLARALLGREAMDLIGREDRVHLADGRLEWHREVGWSALDAGRITTRLLESVGGLVAKGPEALAHRLRAAADPTRERDPAARAAALFALGSYFASSEVTERARQLARGDPDAAVRLAAAEMNPDDAFDVVRAIALDEDAASGARVRALELVALSKDVEASAAVVREVLAGAHDEDLLAAAVPMAEKLLGPGAAHELPGILTRLVERRSRGRGAAAGARALGRLATAEAEPLLIRLVSGASNDAGVAEAAADALAAIGTRESLAPLKARRAETSNGTDLALALDVAIDRVEGRLGAQEAGRLSLLEPEKDGALSLAGPSEAGAVSIVRETDEVTSKR